MQLYQQFYYWKCRSIVDQNRRQILGFAIVIMLYEITVTDSWYVYHEQITLVHSVLW